jgi:hypothetical protein
VDLLSFSILAIIGGMTLLRLAREICLGKDVLSKFFGLMLFARCPCVSEIFVGHDLVNLSFYAHFCNLP